MITAAEAKKLAMPLEVENHLAELEGLIKNAAKNGKSKITIRKDPYARWAYNLNNLSCETGKKVISKLRESGFTLECYYKELQFVDLVDLGLIIKW